MNREIDKTMPPCPPDCAAEYGVSITENVTRDGEAVQDVLTFDIRIEQLESMDGGKTKVRYRKQNQRFNGLEILSAFDDIVMETGKAFWKLDLLVGHSGEISDITNIREIQEEWKSRRKIVEMTYKGYLVEEFLDDMQSRVSDDAVLKDLLANEYSLCFFIKGIYNDQRTSDSFKSTLYNYLGTSVIRCTEERRNVMDDGRRMIELQGRHTEAEGVDGFMHLVFGLEEYDANNFLCNYNGIYRFDAHNMLESANVSICASYMPHIKKETTIAINKTQHHGQEK